MSVLQEVIAKLKAEQTPAERELYGDVEKILEGAITSREYIKVKIMDDDGTVSEEWIDVRRLRKSTLASIRRQYIENSF